VSQSPHVAFCAAWYPFHLLSAGGMAHCDLLELVRQILGTTDLRHALDAELADVEHREATANAEPGPACARFKIHVKGHRGVVVPPTLTL